MNEAERERILDARVQRRLATDRAYRNAENSEEQSKREAEIEREEDQNLPHARRDRLAWCPVHGEVPWTHTCPDDGPMAVTLTDDDCELAVTIGTYIVFDPTGRDLNDCLEVGRVVGREIGTTTPVVRLNGSSETVAVDRVKTVLS